MMNPDKGIINDNIKVMAHIDACNSPYTYMRIKSLDSFKRANLEGQKHLKDIKN